MKDPATTTSAAVKNGSPAEAILAAGIGLAVTGLVTVTSENILAWLNALAWSKPVGALAGKTTLGLIGWIASWIILGRDLEGQRREAPLGSDRSSDPRHRGASHDVPTIFRLVFEALKTRTAGRRVLDPPQAGCARPKIPCLSV